MNTELDFCVTQASVMVCVMVPGVLVCLHSSVGLLQYIWVSVRSKNICVFVCESVLANWI